MELTNNFNIPENVNKRKNKDVAACQKLKERAKLMRKYLMQLKIERKYQI